MTQSPAPMKILVFPPPTLPSPLPSSLPPPSPSHIAVLSCQAVTTVKCRILGCSEAVMRLAHRPFPLRMAVQTRQQCPHFVCACIPDLSCSISQVWKIQAWPLAQKSTTLLILQNTTKQGRHCVSCTTLLCNDPLCSTTGCTTGLKRICTILPLFLAAWRTVLAQQPQAGFVLPALESMQRIRNN